MNTAIPRAITKKYKAVQLKKPIRNLQWNIKKKLTNIKKGHRGEKKYR